MQQLLQFIENKNVIFSLRVKDKYSDYGIVGLLLVEIKDRKAIVRNYLLSCRALGRKIEYDFFENVLAYFVSQTPHVYIIAYKPPLPLFIPLISSPTFKI